MQYQTDPVIRDMVILAPAHAYPVRSDQLTS